MKFSKTVKHEAVLSFLLALCLISLPLLAQSDTSESAESTKSPRQQLSICQEPESTQEATVEATAEATAEATEALDCIPEADITIWYVNTTGGALGLVRACPARTCEVLERLPFATPIRVFATENGWHSILLEDDTVGYIATTITSPYVPQAQSVDTNDDSNDPNASVTATEATGNGNGNPPPVTSGSSSSSSSGTSTGQSAPTATRAGDPND